MQQRPDFSIETRHIRSGRARIAGVDEVGRGPLAGPVVAAAVILPEGAHPEGMDDSKKMIAKRRETAFRSIQATCQVGIGIVDVDTIDRINILQASLLAMCRALAYLPHRPDLALIDGNRLPADLPCPGEAVVGGDGKSLSIAAASIIAKVTRDRIMVDLAQQHPGYGWERNAGYPTKEHTDALRSLGVSPCHRRSFKPVHNILYQE